MKSLLTLLCLTGLVSASTGIPFQAQPTTIQDDATGADAPVLEWLGGTKGYNAGIITGGEVLQKTYVMMNTGGSDLVVKKLTVTCNCTTFETTLVNGEGQRSPFEAGGSVAPGETMEIAMQVDTTGKIGKSIYQVMIECNDATRFHATKISFNAREPIQVRPKVLILGKVYPGAEVNGEVLIKGTWDVPFALEVLEHKQDDSILTELIPIEPNEAGLAQNWRLKVKALGSMRKRNRVMYPIPLRARVKGLKGYASLSDGTTEVKFKAALNIIKQELVVSSDKLLSFDKATSGNRQTKAFALWSNDSKFQLDIKPEHARLIDEKDQAFTLPHCASFEIRQRGERFTDVELTLSSLPDDFPTPFKGFVEVRVAHPEQPLMRMPVRIL